MSAAGAGRGSALGTLMASILSIGFALSRSWRTAQRQNEATAARLRLRVAGASSARYARDRPGGQVADLAVMVRGELKQVAPVGPDRVRGGVGVAQVGEEVAQVPGERVRGPRLAWPDPRLAPPVRQVAR